MVRAGNQALVKIQRAVLRLQQPSQPFQKGASAAAGGASALRRSKRLKPFSPETRFF